MSDLDTFLSDFLPRYVAAEAAFHRGDLEPRLALWARNDPVTLFGALGPSDSGWPEVSSTFENVAARLSGNTAFRYELIAAGISDTIAYTVGYEHFSTAVDCGESLPVTLRVTQIYRREDGQWKIVHRHGDQRPAVT